jgi:hypothetical protein
MYHNILVKTLFMVIFYGNIDLYFFFLKRTNVPMNPGVVLRVPLGSLIFTFTYFQAKGLITHTSIMSHFACCNGTEILLQRQGE